VKPTGFISATNLTNWPLVVVGSIRIMVVFSVSSVDRLRRSGIGDLSSMCPAPRPVLTL
jgi:hypothetical protein